MVSGATSLISGRDALAAIEGAIGKARGNEQQLDAALRSAEEEAARLRADRTAALASLARVRLDAMMQEGATPELLRSLDSAERRALDMVRDSSVALKQKAAERTSLYGRRQDGGRRASRTGGDPGAGARRHRERAPRRGAEDPQFGRVEGPGSEDRRRRDGGGGGGQEGEAGRRGSRHQAQALRGRSAVHVSLEREVRHRRIRGRDLRPLLRPDGGAARGLSGRRAQLPDAQRDPAAAARACRAAQGRRGDRTAGPRPGRDGGAGGGGCRRARRQSGGGARASSRRSGSSPTGGAGSRLSKARMRRRRTIPSTTRPWPSSPKPIRGTTFRSCGDRPRRRERARTTGSCARSRRSTRSSRRRRRRSTISGPRRAISPVGGRRSSGSATISADAAMTIPMAASATPTCWVRSSAASCRARCRARSSGTLSGTASASATILGRRIVQRPRVRPMDRAGQQPHPAVRRRPVGAALAGRRRLLRWRLVRRGLDRRIRRRRRRLPNGRRRLSGAACGRAPLRRAPTPCPPARRSPRSSRAGCRR